jgi:hypothetical protein
MFRIALLVIVLLLLLAFVIMAFLLPRRIGPAQQRSSVPAVVLSGAC